MKEGDILTAETIDAAVVSDENYEFAYHAEVSDMVEFHLFSIDEYSFNFNGDSWPIAVKEGGLVRLQSAYGLEYENYLLARKVTAVLP